MSDWGTVVYKRRGYEQDRYVRCGADVVINGIAWIPVLQLGPHFEPILLRSTELQFVCLDGVGEKK